MFQTSQAIDQGLHRLRTHTTPQNGLWQLMDCNGKLDVLAAIP
jgi:hypothetical protein